jgi:predicted anti-sigma-YlaC factor YlaD
VSSSLDRDCRRARELVSLSLDGELGSLERRRLERHMRECVVCRRRGAEMEAITLMLRCAPLERPSLSFLTHRSRRLHLLRAGAVAAVLAVAALGAGSLQGSAGRGIDGLAPVVNVSGTPEQARISHAPPPLTQAPVYADTISKT